jgi:hypothetical protein
MTQWWNERGAPHSTLHLVPPEPDAPYDWADDPDLARREPPLEGWAVTVDGDPF